MHVPIAIYRARAFANDQLIGLSNTNGHEIILDMKLRQEDFTPYLERLGEIPFVADARLLEVAAGHRGRDVDALVLVRTRDGKKSTHAAELKRTHLSREVGERLLHMRNVDPELLLFAPHVGREIAGRLGNAKLNFIDLAGNHHLQLGDRYYSHVEGKRQEPRLETTRGLRAPAYRVLFALLVKPELVSASARALAEAAGGVSPQTALDARRRLHERGLLVGSPRAPKWHPTGRKSALDLFISGYAGTLAPRLAIGRFRARQRDTLEMETALASKLDAITSWRWGGGAACQRLTGYYRGDTTTVYVEEAPPKLAHDLQLVADRQGPISISKRPSPLAFESPALDTVHPLLAYADLLADGEERAKEAAGEIYERYLEPNLRGVP